MTSYRVEVTIQNKPLAQDPEGETIRKNLLTKGGFSMVTSVRTGKFLQLQVGAQTPDEAQQIVSRICNELRIFNPVVHTCSIRVGGEPS